MLLILEGSLEALLAGKIPLSKHDAVSLGL